MTPEVNPPESWGKAPPPTPTIPRYERDAEFRQSLLETARRAGHCHQSVTAAIHGGCCTKGGAVRGA